MGEVADPMKQLQSPYPRELPLCLMCGAQLAPTDDRCENCKAPRSIPAPSTPTRLGPAKELLNLVLFASLLIMIWIPPHTIPGNLLVPVTLLILGGGVLSLIAAIRKLKELNRDL